MSNPGEITLVPIGPLTNIAVAIIREPRIVEHVKEIILMGGVTRLGNNGIELPPIEHNVKCDPEAASLVFFLRGSNRHGWIGRYDEGSNHIKGKR